MQIQKALLSIVTTGALLTAGTVAFASGNQTTGPDSDNINATEISSNASVDIMNESTVNDDFIFNVEAGRSTVERNTVVGDVETGDVDGMITVSHELNNGQISMAGDDLDFLFPDFDMSNNLTGPDSTNINRIDVALDRNISVINDATYRSNYDINANTGRNTIMRNTQVGDVSSGDVNIGIDESVTTNGGVGSISIPMMSEVNLASGSMDNDITGPNSTNRNTVDVDSNQNVSIANTSRITNNVDADINTGRNTIERNTVVGNVRTGSVSFNVNVSSNAN